MRSVPGRQGYVIVLVGAFVFALSCFLPYYIVSIPPDSPEESLFRLIVLSNDATALMRLGGLLYLFAGIATITWIALAGLIGPRGWAPAALFAVVAAWSLAWIGQLLNYRPEIGPRGVGYWLLLISILMVAAGTILVWSRVRRDKAPLAAP